MFASARWFSRLAFGMVLLACADTTDPTAPSAVASADAPQLSTEGGGSAPSPEELAEMPSEFASSPAIYDFGTKVEFLPAENRVIAQGTMSYLASHASQNVTLSLRFDNSPIASTEALGENSDWLPWFRGLSTTASLGVSGACGHLADGGTIHKAWHQFLVGGWKFLSWGNEARSSNDSAEQPQCAPSPPPSGGGGPDEYEDSCWLCQQWFYYIDGEIVDEWWECDPIDGRFCEGLMT